MPFWNNCTSNRQNCTTFCQLPRLLLMQLFPKLRVITHYQAFTARVRKSISIATEVVSPVFLMILCFKSQSRSFHLRISGPDYKCLECYEMGNGPMCVQFRIRYTELYLQTIS